MGRLKKMTADEGLEMIEKKRQRPVEKRISLRHRQIQGSEKEKATNANL